LNLDFVVPLMMPSVTGTAALLFGICCYWKIRDITRERKPL